MQSRHAGTSGSAPEVVVFSDVIAPGGGPPGYVHNLRAGVEMSGPPSPAIRFIGADSDKRYSIVGPGPGRVASRLADSLPGPAFTLLRHGVHAVRRALAFLRLLARPYSRTDRELRDACRQADLVVFHGFQPLRRIRQARRRGCAIGYMPHSPVPFAEESAANGASLARQERELRRERELFLRADVITFPCPESTGPYRAAFGDDVAPDKVHYIESGVPDVTTARTGDPDRIRVVFAGRYVAHKGYDLFLEAAEQLTSQGIAADFLSMGGGPDARASAAVHDLGWQEDPSKVFATASVVVVPNRVAYYDLLPLEVAAQGIGLVMTTVGGNLAQLKLLPDAIGCRQDEVADGIARAVSELRRRPEWGARNRDAYLTHFALEPFAQRWVSLFGDVLEPGRSA